MADPTRRSITALALASLAAGGQAGAQPTEAASTLVPASLEALSVTVTNMGYDVRKAAGGRSFAITANGQFDVIVTFSANEPGVDILGYIYLQRYDPAEFAKLDLVALLASNDSEYSYFSLSKSDADYKLFLQRGIQSAAASPANVRALLVNLQKVTYATQGVWDKSRWR